MDVLDWDSTRVFELDGHEDHFTSSRKHLSHFFSHTLFPSIFFSSCAFFNDHQFFLFFVFCEHK